MEYYTAVAVNEPIRATSSLYHSLRGWKKAQPHPSLQWANESKSPPSGQRQPSTHAVWPANGLGARGTDAVSDTMMNHTIMWSERTNCKSNCTVYHSYKVQKSIRLPVYCLLIYTSIINRYKNGKDQKQI